MPGKPRRRMLQADFEEHLADLERRQGRAPVPSKRRQPKIKRHMSYRQRVAFRQTRNTMRAMYQPEPEMSQTPLYEGDLNELTREVGPGDLYNRFYRAGKATTTAFGAGNKVVRRWRRTQGRKPKDPGQYLKESINVKYSEMWPNQRPEVKEERQKKLSAAAAQYLR